MIQSALLLLDIPFSNAITDAKASLALLHVIGTTRDFLTQILPAQPGPVALGQDLLANDRVAVYKIGCRQPFTVLK